MNRLLLLVVALLATAVHAQPTLQPLGTYATGLFDEGAAEIVDYDPLTQRAFFVNAGAGQVQAIDLSDPAAPTLVFSINLPGGGPNSVAVSPTGGFIAVAVEADVVTDNGEVRFYSTDGVFLNAVPVGALPDGVAFSPDGDYVVVANEGEPDDGVDPEGSISVIDVSGGAASASVASVGFTDYNAGGTRQLDDGVLLDPGAASVAQDLEPEYVAIYGTTAYVTIQEANAIAVVDLPTATLTGVYGLGFKDHRLAGNGIDPSDRDDAIDIRTVPVYGAYQPDALAAFEHNGTVYLVTANEGDARDDARVKDLDLDPTAFPDAAELQKDENLGRLEIIPTVGDTDGDGDYDELYSFGARSFTVFAVGTDGLTQVFDSGDEFEQITASAFPEFFNATNDENDFDSRSDAKGPEPEAVTVGMVGDRRYAYVGLERIGGVMVYDITDPAAPAFVEYVNNRDFTAEPTLGDGASNPAAGDLGPEGIAFISAADSPTGQPLLLVSNEISGTVTAYSAGPPVACADGAPLAFDTRAFDTNGDDPTFGELVTLRNLSADPLDLSSCSVAAFDPLTEQVVFSTPLSGTVSPEGDFTLSTRNGAQVLPANSIPDGPGAIVLIEGTAQIGATVGDVLGSGLIAGVVYRSETDIFAAQSDSDPNTSAESFVAALASLASSPVAGEESAEGVFALTVAPNPVAGHGTVGFELAESADVTIALYDALGREVAPLADAPYAAGRHSLALATADLPVGVYVVRAQLGETVRTVRLTVVR